ncbi:unnamed protein product [Schistosoma mattheei]|uniref:Uncharacterized protein n=1 Tax=Schistosoma mattheei TaxID=31246 RepID=A0A183NIE7_9TREM|nr:unnamed protein product [Schistosoma mattheei]
MNQIEQLFYFLLFHHYSYEVYVEFDLLIEMKNNPQCLTMTSHQYRLSCKLLE